MSGSDLSSQTVELATLPSPPGPTGGLFLTSPQTRLRRLFSVENPSVIDISEDLARIVPEAMARRYELIPLGQRDHRLIVGMLDPENQIAIEDLHFVTGFNIQPVLLLCADLPDFVPGQSVPLERAEIKAHLSGPAAFVTVTHVFRNPSSQSWEAVYLFPRPHNLKFIASP